MMPPCPVASRSLPPHPPELYANQPPLTHRFSHRFGAPPSARAQTDATPRYRPIPELLCLLTVVMSSLTASACSAPPSGSEPIAGSGAFALRQDIGDVPVAGELVQEGPSNYLLSGSGADIWGARDSFHYAYNYVSGDLTLSAHVDLMDAQREPFRKAVLMMRSNSRNDAAHVSAALHENGLAALQYRPGAGGPTLELRSVLHRPTWLRLERVGESFTAFFSSDGDTWDAVGPLTVSLPHELLVGIGVSSHDTERSSQVRFADVSVIAPSAP